MNKLTIAATFFALLLTASSLRAQYFSDITAWYDQYVQQQNYQFRMMQQ